MVDVEKILKEKGALIDKEIEAVFPKTGIPNLNDAVWYHLGTGGKRLRPVLAIATTEALGGDTKKVVPFAAACEILHNWFLVHDDIEDGDKVRRDQPTVWVKYGVAHAINVGDYMAQKVYELIVRSKNCGVDNETLFNLLKATVDTTLKTAEGQTEDIDLRDNNSPTEKEYMNSIISKTAYYLTLPIVGGAIVAGRKDLTQKIIDFGMLIGPAFQIIDDVLDLTSGKGRKEIGRDIKEGKRSIMVVHCLQKCTKDERNELLVILNKKPDDTTDNEVLTVKSLFEKYGSIEYAKEKADDLIKKSKLIQFEPKLKEILDFFADYIVNRKK